MSTLEQKIEELGNTFAEFSAKNEERLAMAAKGAVDAVLDQQVDRMNARISDLQDEIKAENAAAVARADELEARMNRERLLGGHSEAVDREMSNARQFYAQVKKAPVDQIEDPDIEEYRAYKRAFNAWVRGDEQRVSRMDLMGALSVGSDPDGGYLAPAETANRVVTRLFETSPVRQVANVQVIGSEALVLPTDTNDATSGGWVGEKAARSETATPDIGEQRIPAHEQYANPAATQKLLDDANVDVEGWLANKIASKMLRTENAAFVTGNGVAKPTGFIGGYSAAAVTTADASRDWGVLQYVASGASGGFPVLSGGTVGDDADALIDMYAALKPEYRQGAVWAMNRSTEAAIRKLKNEQGDKLIGMNLSDSAAVTMLHGYPIVNFEDMADIAANSFSIAFGNFGVGYTIVDRVGFRVLRDPFTNKPFVHFYTTKRVGGDVENFDAIKLMKFAAS